MRLTSRTLSAARQSPTRIAEVLQRLGLRLSERKTKLVTAYQGWTSWGTGWSFRKGSPRVHQSEGAGAFSGGGTAAAHPPDGGKSFRALVSRLGRYLRGWGKYLKRTQVVLDRYDRLTLRRLRAFVAKRWRNEFSRRYPDRYFWLHIRLTRLYQLRCDFLRALEVRRRAGHRPVERSAGDPARYVRSGEGGPCRDDGVSSYQLTMQ